MKINLIKKPHIYTVKSQSLEQLAQRFEVSVHSIKELNNIESVSPGDIIAVPQEDFYIVKPADTLEKIAKKLNVSKYELMQKNKVDRVFIGQILLY